GIDAVMFGVPDTPIATPLGELREGDAALQAGADGLFWTDRCQIRHREGNGQHAATLRQRVRKSTASPGSLRAWRGYAIRCGCQSSSITFAMGSSTLPVPPPTSTRILAPSSPPSSMPSDFQASKCSVREIWPQARAVLRTL